MFTENPVTGADERVIEASWGLGEAVVAGLVIPDTYRVARAGEVLERTPGLKRTAIRTLPTGGTVEETIPADRAEQLSLDDAQLGQLHQLALRCDEVYGSARDIEWAFADGTLYLLQCRAVTTHSSTGAPTAHGDGGDLTDRDHSHRAAVRRARSGRGRADRRGCSRSAGSPPERR